MSAQPSDKAHRLPREGLFFSILLALIFFAFIFAWYPFREKIQFDTDEGLNVMRSMLVTLGYPLYSAVSSDQPPLFTQILAVLFRFVGFEVNPARMVVLAFSTMLFWAAARFLQLTSGRLAAALFVPLLIMVPQFLRLSTSVMIGVPSLALAFVSMLLVVCWHRQKKDIWLALSGLALALSVLIKLFTGFVAPIFLAGMIAAEYLEQGERRFSWKLLRPGLVWGVSFGGLVIGLGLLLVGPQNIAAITAPHMKAPTVEFFQSDSFTINLQLRAAVPLLLLGGLGAALSLYRRNWLALYLIGWAAVAYGLFSFYSPVFYHHQLLITIPMTMLAAAGVGEAVSWLGRVRSLPELIRLRSLAGIAALIGFVLISLHYLPGLDRELMDRPRLTDFSLRATPGKLKVIRTMDRYRDRTNWIVTDMPMYAFLVERPVPPVLATFSIKRLATGSLTEDDILAAMREYQPEQVLIARFHIPALEAYLQENYTLVLSVEFFRLFLRNDIQPAKP